MSDLIQYKQYDNLKVRKYKRKVFYDNLWNEDPLLLESRGHVLDMNDNIVARPFKKIFNYKENNTIIDLDTTVVSVKKVNGFMFHVTKHTDFIVEGTTGSLDSDFVKLAKDNMIKHCIDYSAFDKILSIYKEPMTCIFEIKDNVNDPHIIDDEEDGVYLLGVRSVSTGNLLSQADTDKVAYLLGAKRPKWEIKKFSDVLDEVSKVEHEGFVIYDINTNDGLLKLKSPFYISKKSLMRKNTEKVFKSNYESLVDEEYYPIIKKIRTLYKIDVWSKLKENEKGVIFNVIYQVMMMQTDEMIKHILSYYRVKGCNETNSLQINYDSYTKLFISSFNLLDINNEIITFETKASTVEETIENLYIKFLMEIK